MKNKQSHCSGSTMHSQTIVKNYLFMLFFVIFCLSIYFFRLFFLFLMFLFFSEIFFLTLICRFQNKVRKGSDMIYLGFNFNISKTHHFNQPVLIPACHISTFWYASLAPFLDTRGNLCSRPPLPSPQKPAPHASCHETQSLHYFG